MTAPSLSALSEPAFAQQVNAAFRTYHSTLTLSRSPLANSPLVAPALVLDDVSPTADERGHALRLVLQWAVNQLAPGDVQYPLDTYRPFDDPTWRDPHWWRYNILRHRYLEPLHPDDFIEGGRYTETLLALTGISSSDTFFDERNRAIGDVAQWLHAELFTQEAAPQIRRLALEEVYRPLRSAPHALTLLGIATIFEQVFPRNVLLRLAADEGAEEIDSSLNYLITRRYLQTGDGGANLWMSQVLRSYVYERQPDTRQHRRHGRAARYFLAEGPSLPVAYHLYRAGEWQQAAETTLAIAPDLINDLRFEDLSRILLDFKRNQLPDHLWRAVQISLSELYHKNGQHGEALSACREAIKAADTPTDQACVYWRLGKLYEKHNQLHALGYYQQAVTRFQPDDPELPNLLKDRGWLYILRGQWDAAETDLKQALACTMQHNHALRADILDALAVLYRRQGQYDRALVHARNALSLREEQGTIARIASSFSNLGKIYRAMGDYHHAVAAYEEALVIFRKLGNQQSIAGSHLNIGSAYHLSGDVTRAIVHYRQSLAIGQANHLPLAEATARYNLAEALAAQGKMDEACQHWEQGYKISLLGGFRDEIAAFEKLRAETGALHACGTLPDVAVEPLMIKAIEKEPTADPEEAEILALAADYGRLTPKLIMEAVHVSKATATRRLTSLVERGFLTVFGQGRGTYYTLAHRTGSSVAAPPQIAPDHLVQLVRQAAATIGAEYGLTRLGLLLPMQNSGSVPSEGSFTLLVCFNTLPTLLQFFALENRLAKQVGVALDLKPVDGLSPSEHQPVEANIHWVWQSNMQAE